MNKRTIKIGDYDTAAKGWTLAGWQLSAAELKTNYVDKPGGDGSWDLSTAMTDGIPRYKDRNLTATLETSEGTRVTREAEIRDMINTLDGLRFRIELPDDNARHLSGRVHVARNYSDLAHASVTVTAVCEPWLYSNQETVITLPAQTQAQTIDVINNGRRAVVPMIEVEGSVAFLQFGTSNTALSPGTHQWSAFVLTPGTHKLVYINEAGTIQITYREAVLE